MKLKTLLLIFPTLLVLSGCAGLNVNTAGTHLETSKHKALKLLSEYKITEIKDPKVIIIETRKEMKQKRNELSGVYEFTPAFTQPYINKLYLYKHLQYYGNLERILIHEWAHLILAKAGVPIEKHHKIIWSFGY